MATQDFKGLDYLFVILSSDSSSDHPATSYEEFADLLADRLLALDGINGVVDHIQDFYGIIRALAPPFKAPSSRS